MMVFTLFYLFWLKEKSQKITDDLQIRIKEENSQRR